MNEAYLQFIWDRYGEAYLSGREKLELMERDGVNVLDSASLKDKYRLTFMEQAALNMPRELFEQIEEARKTL